MSKKSRSPRSEGELSKFVLAYARQHGIDVFRVRSWISYMAFADVLERRRDLANHPPFIFKGGVVMELRLHGRARATQDVDLILEHPSADLVAELEHALTKESDGFAFRRKGPLQDFGLEGPAFISCIALHQHIAQKLHGVTRPARQDHPNARFRDIMDILLLRDLIVDFSLAS